ncbi:MAG: hypothetical protein H6670_03555 [Anaerolineaceae bacterium]|nr:hypothetical protein [Anaerolineaceae bacterium]
MTTTAMNVSQITDWLGILRQLVCTLNRPDIRSLDAFLSKLTGDANTALMLLRLLYWTPKSKREGWIYKSWRDWNAECNLSQSQIKRVHSLNLLETVGIVREIRKANGVPTMHYRLDPVAFLRQVGEYLGINLEQLEALSGLSLTDQSARPEQPIPEDDSRPTELVETAKPLTDINLQAIHSDNTNTQTTASVDDEFDSTELAETNLLLLDLVDIGFDLITSHCLVSRYENRDIQQALNRAREAEAFNPPGFILTSLRDTWNVSGKLCSKSKPSLASLEDGKRYAEGKYAEFIES